MAEHNPNPEVDPNAILPSTGGEHDNDSPDGVSPGGNGGGR